MIPKDRTVDALGSVWSSIRQLLGTLTEDQWSAPTVLPGWDVRATVAHIVGTERMLMGDAPEIGFDRESEADTASAPHVRNDIGALNEAWVRTLTRLPTEELCTEFDRVTEARLTALREMSQAEWDAESFTPAGPDAFGRFMQIRVFDCWFHEQDIREAIGRPGHSAGQAVAVTLDEVTTALGFVVGKRAAAPQGTTVAFELTGSSGRTIAVEVAERARVIDALDGPATVTITMPVVPFTRLCGGRASVADVEAEIELDGDVDLGRTILAKLAYTI